MKDSYSFDRDAAGLDESYALHIKAYDAIFDRSGLEWYRVEADVGMMGGSGAHEYMAPCAAGENEVALSDAGYAANVEVASGEPQPVDGLPEPLDGPRARRDARRDDDRGGRGDAGGASGRADQGAADDRRGPRARARAGARRPPAQRDQAPERARRARARPAEAEEVRELFGTEPGFIGPVGAQVDVIADEALRGLRGLVTGANAPDLHLRGVEPGRDFEPEWADVRRVEAGDRCPNGGEIRIEPAIEVANIFKLGTRYSEPLGARYLDEQGAEQPIVMGSYGIGPARVVAAAIEQYHDEQGISWPRAVAPFDVELVGLGKEGEEARTVADRLYEDLRAAGLDIALRRPRGQPRREVRRRRAARLPAAAHGRQARRRGRRGGRPDQARAGAALAAARRRSGRRRGALGKPSPDHSAGWSGWTAPAARRPETRRGEALHPLTIPNAIGFARIAPDPRLPGLALQSGDGRDTAATILFAFIATSDWLDGMAARVTGQYSRLGALLDPLTDRLLVISGAIVAWEFELLPRWALLVLAAREAFMLVADPGRPSPRHRPERQHARPLGRVAGDGRARPGDDRRDLGLGRDALRRARDDPCSHRAVPARWTSRPTRRLNLYLSIVIVGPCLSLPKGPSWKHSPTSEPSPTGS